MHEGLMEYVRDRTEAILEEKAHNSIEPLIATEREIISEIRTDALECMRELYRRGFFRGTNTINEPALMRKI